MTERLWQNYITEDEFYDGKITGGVIKMGNTTVSQEAMIKIMLDKQQEYIDKQKRLYAGGMITEEQYHENILGPISQYRPYVPLKITHIQPILSDEDLVDLELKYGPSAGDR